MIFLAMKLTYLQWRIQAKDLMRGSLNDRSCEQWEIGVNVIVNEDA